MGGGPLRVPAYAEPELGAAPSTPAPPRLAEQVGSIRCALRGFYGREDPASSPACPRSARRSAQQAWTTSCGSTRHSACLLQQHPAELPSRGRPRRLGSHARVLRRDARSGAHRGDTGGGHHLRSDPLTSLDPAPDVAGGLRTTCRPHTALARIMRARAGDCDYPEFGIAAIAYRSERRTSVTWTASTPTTWTPTRLSYPATSCESSRRPLAVFP